MENSNSNNNWIMPVSGILCGISALILIIEKINQPILMATTRLIGFECVIDDADGYTHVRAKSDGTSKIIYKVKEGEVFKALPIFSDDWVPVIPNNSKFGYMYHNRVKCQNR
jgi:hypothetical protein